MPESFDSLRESAKLSAPPGTLGLTHGKVWSELADSNVQIVLLSARSALSFFFSCVYRAPTVSFRLSVIEKMLWVKSAQLSLDW